MYSWATPSFAMPGRRRRWHRKLPRGSPEFWNLARPLARRIPALRRASNFLDYAVGGIGAYGRVRLGLPYFEERGLPGELLRGQGVAYRQIPASLASARRLSAEVFQFQKRMHFGSEFMTKVDGATMYYSLEARSPFLDQAVWEYAAKLPPRIHFHGGRLKAVLREIARRRAGPEVAFRPKQGFTIPVEKWLAAGQGSHLRALKNGTLLVREGWMEGKALSAAVDEAIAQGELSKQLWHTLVFESWLRRTRSEAR